MKRRTMVSKISAAAIMVMIIASLLLSPAYAAQEIFSADSIGAGVIDLGSGNVGKVIVQFDVAPLVTPQESFIGFCDSSASPKAENEFPIAVKLNADTSISVLDNNEYVLDGIVTYAGDGSYLTVRLEVDLNARKYDAYVYPPGVEAVKIMEGCSFRNGIAIDDLGKAYIYSTDGTKAEKELFKVRNMMVIPFEAAHGEWRAANDPAKGTRLLGTDNTGLVTVEFDVTFHAHGGGILYLDSSAEPSGWGAPVIVNIGDGLFQARNGDGYARIADVPYELGKSNHVKLEIDLDNKKYDVYVDGIQIADDFAFRTGHDMDDVGKVYLLSILDINKADDVFSITNHTVNGVPSVPPAPAATPDSAPAATPAPSATPAPAATTAPATTAAASASSNPKTGDISLIPYLFAAAVGTVGAASLTIWKKNKK